MNRNSALTARARRYLADAAHAFEHAPVEVTLSVLLAAAFSFTVALEVDPAPEWFELAVLFVLIGAVAFTATLLNALGHWSRRTRWLVTGAGAIAAALYDAFVLDLSLAAEAWRAAAFVAAATLVVLSAPAFAGRMGAEERFRRVTGRLLLRTMAVLLYAAGLYAGLAIALGAVNTLFELQLDGRIYAHAFGWVFFVLVTWVVVGGVPDYVRSGVDAGPVAAAVHRISAFLVTPLLAIYYLILYAYAVRIAITGELPKNLVSPLVITAGLLAALALMLFDREESHVLPDDGLRGSGSFRWLRIAAPLFLPLCVLGIWAMSMRLGQYGWTEFRGFRTLLLVMLGLLALGGSVLVLRRRSLPVHLLPLTLAAAALLAAVGPWSVIAASRRSQQARLAGAMSDVGIEWSATAVPDTIIPNEPFMQIHETVRYLHRHFGADALPPVFARHAEGAERFVDVVHAAGLRAARPDQVEPRGAFTQLAHGTAITMPDTLYYVNLQPMPEGRRAPGGQDTIGSDTTALARVRISVAGLNLFADLRPLTRELVADPAHRGGRRTLQSALPPARVALRDASGTDRGELLIIEIGTTESVVYRLVGLARVR